MSENRALRHPAARVIDQCRPHSGRETNPVTQALHLNDGAVARIGQLLLAVGDHMAGRARFQALLYDAERTYGPHPPLHADLRGG